MPSLASNFLTRIFRNLGFQDLEPRHQDIKFISNSSSLDPTSTPKQSIPALLKPGFLPRAISHNDALYSAQASSLLFSKLPIELRELIWENIVGRNTIHMYWKDRDTLLGFVCEKQSPCISIAHSGNRNIQGQLMWGSANDIQERDIVQLKGFVPLLLACRAT